MMELARRTVALAAVEIAQGYAAAHVHEEGGNNRGDQVEFFQRLIGGAPGDPWCADFVCTCLVKGYARFHRLPEERARLPELVRATGRLLLPLSGLFMSVIYPTINSKGISCFPKAQHGAVAGVILFFTAGGAALGPLAMGRVSDIFGGAKYGFMLAAGFATLLFVGALLNWIFDPSKARLHSLDQSEY